MTRKLEHLERPDLSSATQQKHLKLFLVSARRSSWVGMALVIVPCLFILGVILKYGFRFNLPLFSDIEEAMARIDRSFFRFLPPLVLVAAPLAALCLNLLAILHFEFQEARRELVVTVKMKPANLLIIAICVLILLVFLLYAMAENAYPLRAAERGSVTFCHSPDLFFGEAIRLGSRPAAASPLEQG